MATIEPFCGVRFHPHVVDPSLVISQPYDRVRYGLQERYYALHPYNIVRIIRGVELPTDLPDRLEGPNVYTRARAYYDLWRIEGVLLREAQPAIYVYHQTFDLDGERRTRKGFIAALELRTFEEGVVLPHERTHAGPKIDRLRLLRTTEVNLGQIFMLYPDSDNRVSTVLDAAIDGRAPDIDAVEMYESDVRQQLWVITEPGTIRAVQREMSDKRNLIIADGHHRYETALAYRQEMRARHPNAPLDAAYNYRMVALVGIDDPGLVILPTHREVFDYPQVTRAEILARAEHAFEVIPAADLGTCLSEMRVREAAHAFGLYAEGRYHVLVLKDPTLIDEQPLAETHSKEWKSLDVSIAHSILLERVAGLPAGAVETEANIRYHREPAPAIDNVDAGRGNFVLLLNPTRIDQVKACAEQGEKMPQKSTDFYPKMVSGLTLMPVSAAEHI
jgi:uncharacterized protein (DUF1015 family)